MASSCQKDIEVTDGFPNKPARSSPPPSTSPKYIGGLKKHLSVEVTTSHADILLLVCCVISGLVDSTIYNAYGTFVSMQTVYTFPLLLTPTRTWPLTWKSRATRFSSASVAPRHTRLQNLTAGSSPSSPSPASVSAASSSASRHVFSRRSGAQLSSPLSFFKHSSSWGPRR